MKVGPYDYIPTPLDLGQGSRGMGFVITTDDVPRTAWNAGGAPTRRQMHVHQTPQVFAPQNVSDVSLRGNGVYLQGQMIMQALQAYEGNGQ